MKEQESFDYLWKKRKVVKQCLSDQGSEVEGDAGLFLQACAKVLSNNKIDKNRKAEIFDRVRTTVTAVWLACDLERSEHFNHLKEDASKHDWEWLKAFLKEFPRHKTSLIKAYFLGGREILANWEKEDSQERRLFGSLPPLLKLLERQNGLDRVAWCKANESFLKKDLELTGTAIGQLALTGDLESKKTTLLSEVDLGEGETKKFYEFLKDDLKLTGYAIGQLALTGDLESKKTTLLSEVDLGEGETKKFYEFLKDDLKLTGYAIGQLALTGDLESKKTTLLSEVDLGEGETKKFYEFLKDDLNLTGTAIGQLALNGDLESKKTTLLSEVDLGEGETKKFYEFLKDDLKLTGYAIGQLALTGDLESKKTTLLSEVDLGEGETKKFYEFLKDDLKLTGYAIGQLALTGDLESKKTTLLSEVDLGEGETKKFYEFLKDDLKLTGTAIGQLALTGDLESKKTTLLSEVDLGEGETKKFYEFLKDDLKLTGTAIGQLALNGDLESKKTTLLSEVDLGEGETKKFYEFLKDDLKLTGYAIGQLALTGDLESKKTTLLSEVDLGEGETKKFYEFLKDDLKLTGYAIGQLALNGDLEAKKFLMIKSFKTFSSLNFKATTAYKPFMSADRNIIKQELAKLEALEKVLDSNESLSKNQEESVTFRSVFLRRISGFVAQSKLKLEDPAFSEFLKFFRNFDFSELFIQTTQKQKDFKTYISGKTDNSDYRNLLLIYLTGNKSLGAKQWGMLKKVISGGGRGLAGDQSRSYDGERVSEDRDSNFADKFDLESAVISDLDMGQLLRNFFGDLSAEDSDLMVSFISGMEIEISAEKLDQLLGVFGDKERLKTFLSGEMSSEDLAAISSTVESES